MAPAIITIEIVVKFKEVKMLLRVDDSFTPIARTPGNKNDL